MNAVSSPEGAVISNVLTFNEPFIRRTDASPTSVEGVAFGEVRASITVEASMAYADGRSPTERDWRQLNALFREFSDHVRASYRRRFSGWNSQQVDLLTLSEYYAWLRDRGIHVPLPSDSRGAEIPEGWPNWVIVLTHVGAFLALTLLLRWLGVK